MDRKSLLRAIKNNREEFNEIAQGYMDDVNLSSVGRRKAIEEAHFLAMERHNKLMAEDRRALAEHRADLLRKVFSPLEGNYEWKTPSDKYTLLALYAQAVDRAIKADKDTLVALAEVAAFTGDWASAKAYGLIAYKQGLSKVIGVLEEASDGFREDLKAFYDFEQEYNPQDAGAKLARRLELPAPHLPPGYEKAPPGGESA